VIDLSAYLKMRVGFFYDVYTFMVGRNGFNCCKLAIVKVDT